MAFDKLRNVEVLTMYQELLENSRRKPSYRQEELQWLLDHIGDPNPEIRIGFY